MWHGARSASSPSKKGSASVGLPIRKPLNGRRKSNCLRDRRASVFVMRAMVYSHVVNFASPRKVSMERNTCRNVSCVASQHRHAHSTCAQKDKWEYRRPSWRQMLSRFNPVAWTKSSSQRVEMGCHALVWDESMAQRLTALLSPKTAPAKGLR